MKPENLPVLNFLLSGDAIDYIIGGLIGLAI